MAARVAVLLVVALVFLGATPDRAVASIHTGFTPDTEFDLAPGVHHERGHVLVNQGSARDVSVVSVDASHDDIGIRVSQAGDTASRRETVVDQALDYSREGRRVVASVNGSLFSYMFDGTANGGTGLGFNVSDGELISAGRLGRPGPSAAFGIDENGDPIIGVPDPVITVTLPSGAAVPIDRINQKRQPGARVLYTPKMGGQTFTDALGDEYVIEGFDLPLAPAGTYTGTVVEVHDGQGGTGIGAGQVVLSVSETSPALPEPLSPGDQVSITVSVAAGWQSVTQSVGGRDLLVVDGQSVTPDPDEDGSHPRTAVGIRADGSVFFVTATNEDGANGMNLPDMADLMLSLGAVEALNLDGGGSTQMAIREPGDFGVSMVTHSESEAFFRPVSNALQLVSTVPTGPLADLVVSPADATVAVDSPSTFVAKGQDSAFNGVALDGLTLEWQMAKTGGGGRRGPVSTPTPTSATFVAETVGDYVVTLRSGEMSATANLTAAVDIAPPVVAGLVMSLPHVRSVGLDTALLNIGWSVSDDIAVAGVEVQSRVGARAWQAVSISQPSAIGAAIPVRYGQTVRFRVRAVDTAGHVSTWATSPERRLRLINAPSDKIDRTGTWKRRYKNSAIGGEYLRTVQAGASAALTATGLQVALVGNRGPTLGQAEVTVGDDPATVSATASRRFFRQILYTSDLAATSQLWELTLANGGGELASGFELDAFLVLAAAK